MRTHSPYRVRKQVVWGLMLIGAGSALFLDRLGLVDMRQLWHYWPFALVLFGINKLLDVGNARHFMSGLWLVGLGLWLFAASEQVAGLTFNNSWPFLIIAWGVGMLIEPFARRRLAAPEESDHEK